MHRCHKIDVRFVIALLCYKQVRDLLKKLTQEDIYIYPSGRINAT
jgi:hypothetical protein